MGSRAQFRLASECSQVSFCPNCNENNENNYSEIPSDLGPRRMTSRSLLSENLLGPQLSELQRQYNEIILSYHKLKISFLVILVLNLILLAVVVTCLVFIIPKLNSEESKIETKNIVDNYPTLASKTQPLQAVTEESRSPVVLCQSIINKLGSVYKNGQKVDNIVGKTCDIEDLIESVTQFMKKSKTNSRKKAAFHFTTSRTRLSPCTDSHMRKCLKNWEVKMNTTAITMNEQSIFIPKSGVYFIYNRLSISIDNVNTSMVESIQHSLRHSNTGSRFKDIESSKIECIVKNNKFNHVSSIEQVHNLEQGDEIKIALIVPPGMNNDQNTVSSSSFGMFEL